MKLLKYSAIFFITVVAITFGHKAKAQSNIPNVESLSELDSVITVNVDNSTDVVETAAYNSGPQDRHGMFRDIYKYSAEGREMKITNVSVSDPQGGAVPFEIQKNGDYVRLKIGDPNTTWTGQRIYRIKYNASFAVGQFEKYDEIYWNATGNNWNIPIYSAKATVKLPEGTSGIQYSCYFGPEGSNSSCVSAENEDGTFEFFAPKELYSGDGMTVAVGFPKGVVTPYKGDEGRPGPFEKIWPYILSAILPIIVFVYFYRDWLKNGKDPKGTGVIIPQYDVPDGLTPMEVMAIIEEDVPNEAISAEIIYLAEKGYIKIVETEKKTLGIFKSKDYQIQRLKNYEDLLNAHDRKLMDGLFEISSSQVNISDLKNHFYQRIPALKKAASHALKDKEYYRNLGRMANQPLEYGVLISGVGLIAVISMASGFTFLLLTSLMVSLVIWLIFYSLSPAKTEKGIATKEYLLGLKDYLRIAEKDRLIFHNAPEKKPEVFEKLLPYAIAMGVADIWAKEFADVYIDPTWYASSTGSHFSAVAFSHSITGFSSFAGSSLASSPHSGSGGGGFSGGGGGGGGGGGW